MTARLVVLLLALGGTVRAGTIPVPGAFPTIQAALDGAPCGAVIQVARGIYHERLSIDARHAVTLRGDPDDPAAVVIDGGGAGDVIHMVGATSAMVIEGITFTGGTGYDGYGGGLFMAQSHAVFRRCVFRGNRAAAQGGGACILASGGTFVETVFENNTAGVYGGGVMLNDGSTTAFHGCRFVGNLAGASGPGSGGGAHVNDSSPTFVGCEFRGNRGKSGGGIVVLGHFDVGRSVVTIDDSTIADNVAYRDPDGPGADGGGLHAEDAAEVTLRRCRIRDNVANHGGGLHAYRAVLDVQDSIVDGNEARLEGNVGGFGGGVAGQSVNVERPTRRPATIHLTRTVVRRNSAPIAGGVFMQGDFLAGVPHGDLRIDDSLIADNVARGQGGGIKVDTSDLALRDSHVLRNVVLDEGLTFGGGLVTAAGSVTTIGGTTFAGNRSGPGGIGGAVYADQGGRLDVAASRFTSNAGGEGDGLGGGAIAVGQSPGAVAGPVTGTVRDSVIADNGANGEIFESNCDPAQWSTIQYLDNAIDAGGAVYMRNCTGPSISVAAFNGLHLKASGNFDAPATFVELKATPATIVAGTESVLSWVVRESGPPSLSPGVGAVLAPLGMLDVMPAETTTSTLSAGNGAAAATVEVVSPTVPGPASTTPVGRCSGVVVVPPERGETHLMVDVTLTNVDGDGEAFTKATIRAADSGAAVAIASDAGPSGRRLSKTVRKGLKPANGFRRVLRLRLNRRGRRILQSEGRLGVSVVVHVTDRRGVATRTTTLLQFLRRLRAGEAASSGSGGDVGRERVVEVEAPAPRVFADHRR